MNFTKLYNGTYHRNGISGEGFFSLCFDWEDKGEKGENFLITFTTEGDNSDRLINTVTARVIDLNSLTSNWRGDNFAHDLEKHLCSLGVTTKTLYEFITKSSK